MFCDNLKEECERQGHKITPTVQQCGGKVGSIGGWKNGASPNSDIVMKLATRLNVSTDFLLFGENISETTEDEKELLKAYRSVTEEGKNAIKKYSQFIADNEQYKKYTDIPKEA